MSNNATSSSSSVLSSSTDDNRTLVTLYDIDRLTPHHCGYCNNDGNISIGKRFNYKDDLAFENYLVVFLYPLLIRPRLGQFNHTDQDKL
jgi:hypothetical protein